MRQENYIADNFSHKEHKVKEKQIYDKNSKLTLQPKIANKYPSKFYNVTIHHFCEHTEHLPHQTSFYIESIFVTHVPLNVVNCRRNPL